MSHAKTNSAPQAVERSWRGSSDFDGFLAKLSARDRANMQKRIGAGEGAAPEGAPSALWCRLACALSKLAPHAAKMLGRSAVQYYVADGKYRMQVFALEDLQDGIISVYCPDVLAEALREGVLARSRGLASDSYGIVGSSYALTIKSLDRGAVDPAPYFKDMIGWNRRALRVSLPESASPRQADAAEALCAVAARQFVRPATEEALPGKGA